MTAIFIDFATRATVFCPDLDFLHDSRREASSSADGEITSRMMAKIGPNDPIANVDQHRSALMAAAQGGLPDAAAGLHTARQVDRAPARGRIRPRR